MNIVIFEYRRALGIEKDHNTLYIDYTTIHQNGLAKMVEVIKSFVPDLMVEREYNDGLAIYSDVYKYFPHVPKAYWMIDAHTTLGQHLNYAKQFDYVFCAQSWFQPLAKREVKGKVLWLPLCYPNPDDLNEKMRKIKYELTFIGSIRKTLHHERELLIIELLEQLGDCFHAATIYDYQKMRETMRQGKATLNVSLCNDLNYRVFEALAFNVPLITDYVTDLDRIDGLADHVIGYWKKDAVEDIAQQIMGVLDVVDMGHNPHTSNWIRANHTVTQRLYQLIEMVNSGKQYDYK